MPDLHTQIEARLTLLSPLHISSGAKLERDFDWLAREGQVLVFDHTALFETVLQRAEVGQGVDIAALTGRLMEKNLRQLQEAGWLEEADLQPGSPVLRYTLAGQPHMSQISEQIKDAHGRPYLPGSSFKGALRTILAWSWYAESKRAPDLRQLNPGRSWAAQPLERDIFGRNPNQDWLRALRVADSPPLPPDSLRLEGVQVYPTARRKGGPGLDLDVETIQTNTTFTVLLAVEEYGFQGDAARRLRWQDKRRWLTNLARLGREYARQRLLTEAEYFKAKKGPVSALRFYDELIHTWDALKENEFILQIGWGGGWESKTLGSLLKENERAFEQRVLNNKRYRLRRGQTRRRPGDPFPTSRRLVLRGNEPALPLGWVRVELSE